MTLNEKYRLVKGSFINSYALEYAGRGSIHKSLRGTYSTPKKAIEAANGFEQSKENKVAKTNNSD